MAITERQKRFAVASASGVALTGVILLLLLVLSNWLYLRWDITHTHAYSLSSSSKKLMRTLDDPVVIKAYFSQELPSPYNTYARYVKDLLAEYRSVSHGRVRYEFVPTLPADTFEQHAMEAGMSPLQFEEMGSNQLQIRRGFMGLVMFYHDRTEILPVVKSAEHLEYDLTSRIARMTRKSKKTIAVITGHGESRWRGSQMKLAQDLPAFFDLDHPVDLPASTATVIQADAILVVGPQSKYDEKSLWVIDQSIMHGVPTAFLIDTHKFIPEQFAMMPQPTAAEELLRHYGLKVTDQLVYDAQCETVGMTQNLNGMAFTTSIRFPFVPLVTNFEKAHPILQGVEAIGLPFPTRLLPEKLPAGVTFTPLINSSDHSWLAPDTTYNVSPNSVPRPQPNEMHGPFVLGGLLEGTFPSFFAGRASPIKGAVGIPVSSRTSIFVVGTSHLLDPNLPDFSGTGALVTNMLAYLTHDDVLIGIQAKGDILKPLKPIPEGVKEVIKFICILMIPLLPVLWGLFRWRRREAWRKQITLDLSSSISHA